MAHNSITMTTKSFSVSQTANGPPLDNITQDLSALDLDQATQEHVPPQTVTSNTEPVYTQRSLTRQPLSNWGSPSRPRAAQTESRRLLRERTQPKRIKQLYAVLSRKTGAPGKRQAAIDALARGGHISRLEAENLTNECKRLLAIRADRRDARRTMKSIATRKAEQVARTKALERAIGGLELDVTKPESVQQRRSSPPLVLSLAHAKHIMTRSGRAEEIFSLLQSCQRDPSLFDQLESKQQRRVTLLQKEEESLRTKARENGSIEAAQLWQDQRVAYLEELRKSRHGPSLTADHEDKQTMPSEPFPGTIKCICGFDDDDGNTVLCEHCETWQHTECYYFEKMEVLDVSEIEHHCANCRPRRLDVRGATERQALRRKQAELGDRQVKKGVGNRQEKNKIGGPRLYDSYRPTWDTRTTASPYEGRRNTFAFAPLVGGGDYYRPRPYQPPRGEGKTQTRPIRSGGPRRLDSYRPAQNNRVTKPGGNHNTRSPATCSGSRLPDTGNENFTRGSGFES